MEPVCTLCGAVVPDVPLKQLLETEIWNRYKPFPVLLLCDACFNEEDDSRIGLL